MRCRGEVRDYSSRDAEDGCSRTAEYNRQGIPSEVVVRSLWQACVVVLTVVLLAGASWAQQPPSYPETFPRPGRAPEEEPPPSMTAAQKKKFNQERYTKLKQQTDELLRLATELKQSVDKANENTLSMDVIRKTEQIEKLAKSVRDKMKSY